MFNRIGDSRAVRLTPDGQNSKQFIGMSIRNMTFHRLPLSIMPYLLKQWPNVGSTPNCNGEIQAFNQFKSNSITEPKLDSPGDTT